MNDQELINRLKRFATDLGSDLVFTAADRIKLLVVERDEAVEKLIDQQDEKSIRIRELEAKLAKLDNAAELMRLALPILKKYLQHPNDIWLVDDFRAMLGELEGDNV